MRLGHFQLSVLERTEDKNGYVKLNHGQSYQLNLANYDNKRCAAEVTVDGKHIGTFRINGNRSLILERPSNDPGKFTFYLDGTIEACKVGLDKVSKNNRGLISVTFKPEKEISNQEIEESPWKSPAWPYTYFPTSPTKRQSPWSRESRGSSTLDAREEPTSSNAISCFSSGGTGLSGSSDQKFTTVANLDYDESAFVTINLRLVGNNHEPKELKAKKNSTPIPLPV